MIFTKEKIAGPILILLLIASTFIGVPLNGGDKGWLCINGSFRDFVSGNSMQNYSFLQVLILIWTFVLYLMPIFLGSTYRNTIIIFVPAIYLVLTLLSFPLLIFLCIPFIVCWIILIRVALKKKK